jgi:hypothetical protein
MIFSVFGDDSLRVPTRVRLVDDGDSEALRRKLESVEWKPANGFLRDQVQPRSEPDATRGKRAA